MPLADRGELLVRGHAGGSGALRPLRDVSIRLPTRTWKNSSRFEAVIAQELHPL